MTKKQQKLSFSELCQLASTSGVDSANLSAVLRESRGAKKLARRKVANIKTHDVKAFLKQQRKASNFAALSQEMGDVLAFATAQNFLTKNPLVSSVGQTGYVVSHTLKTLLGIAAVFVLIFGFMVFQRAQQTQEDPLLATADVARDIGWGEEVATFENLYYGQINPAKLGGTPSGPLYANNLVGSETQSPQTTNAKANIEAWGAALLPSQVPKSVVSPAHPALKGEGTWLPTKIVVNGHVAVRIARVRPDSVHTSFLDTLVWLDPKLLAFQEVAGTSEPKGNFVRGNGRVKHSLAPFYVAGINGGYKTDNMHGGFYYNGQNVIALRDGAATFLTYPDGSFDVVNWGHDAVKPGYSSARQNLTMLVENGKNLAKKDDAAKWGSAAAGTSSGHIFVWRSAIGVRADGTVVHLVGPSLSTRNLADLLIRAGVVRGMALDMNMGWASSYFYGPYGKGTPVDPQITHVVSRFRLSSTRDFIAVFAKSPAATK